MGKKKKKQMHVSAGTKTPPVQQNSVQQAKDNKGNEPEIKMNFYSGMSMLTTLLSAATVIIAMILTSRGYYYILQSLYDENKTDIALLNENLMASDFKSNLLIFAYIVAGMLFVTMIISLAETVTAINPNKKPNLIPAIIMVLLSIGAIAVYLAGNTDVKKIQDAMSFVPVSRHMALYSIQLYVLIANAVCTIANVFGQKYGIKLYNQNGKTC